ALSIARAVGSKARESSALANLARLAIERGQAAEAESKARESLAFTLTQQSATARAYAYERLARACLAGKKIAEARDAIAQASALAAQPDVKLAAALTAARVDEFKSRADAIRRLQA